jgi:hypothetical protein
MRHGFAYDDHPKNQLELMVEISNTYLSKLAKDQVWSNGLNFILYEDMHTLQIPALQTLYKPKDSVLTAEINMAICVDVIKMQAITWRRLVGNSLLTEAQFIKRSNDMLLELVAAKYDDRVVIEANTYFTSLDAARGYSWTTEAIVYANVMKTVAVAKLITRRKSDLSTTLGVI